MASGDNISEVDTQKTHEHVKMTNDYGENSSTHKKVRIVMIEEVHKQLVQYLSERKVKHSNFKVGDIACADGSKCSWYEDGWDCCVEKGGKTNCPKRQPFLCSKPNACSDGKEFCCSATEEGCESQNAGSLMCPGK